MPWVDGLRAISIIGVVAYHAGISAVSGGFAGVDVFFVISGFLIIGQIVAKLEAGDFSIFEFYARRALRILPPYYFMLVVVAFAGSLLLVVPKSFEIQAKAAVLAPLMVSNILFFLEQGYFDAAAEQKPFIHTWTLSVEEQFYLVIPIALIILYRIGGGRFGKRAALLAGVAGLLSLIACIQLTTVVERNPAFYLTHLRAWEFIAGGFALPLAKFLKKRASGTLISGLSLSGLGLIGGAFFFLSGADPYPAWRALIPVTGAVIVLAGTGARPETLTAKSLSHSVAVRIGLVSYSWYLWHWPLLSLAVIAEIGPPGWRGVLFAGVLGYIAAELSYRFVETPVKAWRQLRAAQLGDRRIFVAGVVSAFVVSLVCGGITGLGYLKNKTWLETKYGVTSKQRLPNGCHVVTEDNLKVECLTGDYVLLLGDSHADAVAAVFGQELKRYGLELVAIARGGCDPAWFIPDGLRSKNARQCTNLIAPLETVLAAKQPPKAAIVVSLFNDSYSQDSLDVTKLAEMFNARGTAALFVGPVPVFPKPVLECVVAADRQRRPRDECAATRESFVAREAAAAKLIHAGVNGLAHAAFAPIGDVFCDKMRCQPWDHDTLYFTDTNHVTPEGAKRIFDAIEPMLKRLVGGVPLPH